MIVGRWVNVRLDEMADVIDCDCWLATPSPWQSRERRTDATPSAYNS